MSMHRSTSLETQRRIIKREQTSDYEVPFLRILELSEGNALNMIENGENLGYPVMVNKATARLAEIKEQRRIIHAIATGEISPILAAYP